MLFWVAACVVAIRVSLDLKISWRAVIYVKGVAKKRGEFYNFGLFFLRENDRYPLLLIWM
jgi:hypothetical protein